VCDNGLDGALDIADGGAGHEEVLIALESKIAQLLMEFMLMLTVWRRVAVARAYGWVGFKQEGNKFAPRFILLILPTPAFQKLCVLP
jgi:hypothetical protein